MSEDIKNIQVMIAGRTYPLKIKKADEAGILNVVEEINQKVKHFQMTYAHRDKQDCLSMALLTYAVDYHNSIDNLSDAKIRQKLLSIDQLLDEVQAY